MSASNRSGLFKLLLLVVLSASMSAQAATVAVHSITITGGYTWVTDGNGTLMSNPDSTSADKTKTPYTVFAADTNFVGGPLAQIVGFNWFGAPVTTFTNVPGSTVPTAWIDTATNTIYAELSAWHYSWGGSPAIYAGTGVADGWTSPLAVGSWDPSTGNYLMGWQTRNRAFCTATVPEGCLGEWVISGTASVVPVPAAAWLLITGLLALIGSANRRQSHR